MRRTSQAPTNTAATERALIKNYFNKARWWRSKQTTVTDAWRLFVQCEKFLDIVTNARGIARHLTGTIPEENRPFDDVFVTAAEYQGKRFLWGLHGAHGRPEEISFNDTSVTRWRTSYELATNENEPQVVFYMLKGSYFPDWRFTNDFMRACLSTATNGLAAFWSAGTPERAVGNGSLVPWLPPRGDPAGHNERLLCPIVPNDLCSWRRDAARVCDCATHQPFCDYELLGRMARQFELV